MFFKPNHRFANGFLKADSLKKRLRHHKSRFVLEQLEDRLCLASAPYTYSFVAATGDTVNAPGSGGASVGTLTNISLPSINDSGNVAFLGTINGFNGVDEATSSNGSVALTDLSFTNRNFTFPQIDNAGVRNSSDPGDVIAQDQFLVSPNLNTYIRLWQPGGPGTNFTDLETGSSANGDLYLIPTISPNGTQFAYQDDLSGTIVLDIGTIAYVNGTPVVTGTTPVYTFPAGSGGLRPMIADNGNVVVRGGSTTTSPIVLVQPGQTPGLVTIADQTDFSALGNNPGIYPAAYVKDAQGNLQPTASSVVAFYGQLTAEGAANLNASQAALGAQYRFVDANGFSTFPQLEPGSGIFVSIPLTNSANTPRVIIRLAGISGSGYLNPGETWQNNTDVGQFSAFPDDRVMPVSSLQFAANGNLTSGGSVNVAFVADDTTASANQGIYTNQVTITNSGVGPLLATVYNPIQVVNSGETITDSITGSTVSVTGVNVYFPMNQQGQIAFVANTASGGQDLVIASGQSGYSPAQISAAYGINSIPDFTDTDGQPQTPNGAGQTIAIVDADNDPTIANDLQVFDTNYGLPAPPMFRVVNQSGTTNVTTIPDGDTAEIAEIALDVEWAHAIAPGADILLIEYTPSGSGLLADLVAPLQTAAQLSQPNSQLLQQLGLPPVSVVSMSLGQQETSAEVNDDPLFNTPGVTYIASSGDEGAPGDYPAFSPNVVAVGGTTLYLNSDNSYQDETAWGASNGSASAFTPTNPQNGGELQPSYQNGVVSQYSSTQRTTPDVAFDADPRTGVEIYDSSGSGWSSEGGTSVGAPCWAGLIAIANQGREALGRDSLTGPSETLPLLYSLPSQDFNEITTGNNAQYTLYNPYTNPSLFSAAPGYNMVTGLGTPVANLLIPDLVAYDTIWTGRGSSDLWSNPANWSGNILPAAGEDVLFPSGALQETSVNDLGLTFGSVAVSGNYSFSGGALATSTLDVSQGSLELACSATVSGTITIAAGASVTLDAGNTLDIQGTLNVAATGNLTLAGIGMLDSSGSLNNMGTVTVVAGGTLSDQGAVTVASGGMLTDQGTIAVAFGAMVTVASGGSLTEQGTDTIASGGTLTDQGTVTVATGGTLTDQGTVTIASGGTLTDQNSITVATGGTLTDQGTLTIASDGTLDDSGTFTVVGALQVTGSLELASGGVLDDQGSVTVAPTTGDLLDEGMVTVESGASLDDQGTVVVANEFMVAGTVTVESGALLSVGAAGTLGISSTVTVASGGTLADQGTVTVPSGGTLTDQGTVTVASGGTLTVDGTNTVASGATLDDQGTAAFEGFATLDDSGSVSVGSGAQLTLSASSTVEKSGTLTDQGTVTVGALDTLDDMGTVTVASGATLDDTGTVTVASGGNLDDQGTVTVETAAALHDSGTVTVATGAHLDLSGKVTVDGTLDDQGAVTVGFTSTLDILDLGNVQVESTATLDINGAVTVESGATLDDSGTLTVEQLGTLDDKGSVTVDGTLDDFGVAANAVTVEVGVTLGVSGKLIVESNAFLDIKGTVEINTGGSLNDQGTVTVESTGLLSDQDAITVAAGATLDVSGHLTEGVGGALDDFGTLIIEPGAALDIFGTVTVEPGATYKPLGTVTVEPGGTLTMPGQAAPVIVVSTSSLNLGTTTQGTAGTSQSFTVSGSNLTADILLTAPSGVQLSDNGGTSYSTTLDLAESWGTVGTTTVLARITATAPVGPVSGMIAADSTGATEQDITVSGTVNPVPTPTITVSTSSLNLGTTTQGTAAPPRASPSAAAT